MAKSREEDERAVLLRANAQAEARIQAETGGPSLYEEMWRLLDKKVVRMMSATTRSDKVAGEALGIAQCIALIGRPLVSSVDEVREEAMRRYERGRAARKATKPARRSRSGQARPHRAAGKQ